MRLSNCGHIFVSSAGERAEKKNSGCVKVPWMKGLNVAVEKEVRGALSEVAEVTPVSSSFTAFILSLTSSEDSRALRVLAAC